MDNSDKPAFASLMGDLAQYYRQDPLGRVVLKMYFNALKQFSYEQVEYAAERHMTDTKSGQFFPKIADFVRALTGEDITADMIIAAARQMQTPLGCLARMHIGSWDLDNKGNMSGSSWSFYIRQRAEEVIQLLPEWKAKANAGEYTDHEISVMLKYNISPAAPFFAGLAAPENANALLARADTISKSERHLKFIEPPHDASDTDKKTAAHPDVQKHIALLTQEVSTQEEETSD
jgi:hypothetical protein